MILYCWVDNSCECKKYKFVLFFRKFAILVKALIRGVLFSCGYHKLRIIEPTISADEDHKTKAAIVVAAPHTTFFDAVILFACDDFPTGVSRIENGNIPFLGG